MLVRIAWFGFVLPALVLKVDRRQYLPDVAVRARYEHAHRRQFHTFQGALPVAQISSRRTLSRSVSMHCQKPACR